VDFLLIFCCIPRIRGAGLARDLALKRCSDTLYFVDLMSSIHLTIIPITSGINLNYTHHIKDLDLDHILLTKVFPKLYWISTTKRPKIDRPLYARRVPRDRVRPKRVSSSHQLP
jgi:hypothetical protein